VVVAVLQADLRLPEAFSLKDKRSVVQSLLRRSERRFRVCAAEVGWQDDLGRARIAAAMLSADGVQAERVLQSMLRFIESEYPVEVLSAEVERR